MTNVNIENIDITAFRKWQQAGNRSVKVQLGETWDRDYCKIWVYDYELMAGQYVQSVDEIDLEKILAEKATKELNRLKKLGVIA